MSTPETAVGGIIERCEALHDDLKFSSVIEWKSQGTDRKAIGYMPIYIPREIVHAAGMLPVGIVGGGDRLEIIRGDSYFQSYICHIPRSTIELGLLKHLDCMDGFIFPSICDVIRNLSGMWKVLFPGKYVKYFDVPQNFDLATGGEFYRKELQEFKADLEKLSGQEITTDKLNQSIDVYNENRKLVYKLYGLRREKPWIVPTTESYLLLRAGNVLSVEDHNKMLTQYLKAVVQTARKPLDNCRVILRGVFCEQPPLGLIKTLERSGCYIVDDDFVLISRWLMSDTPFTDDPIHTLCRAFMNFSTETGAKYDHGNTKAEVIVELVKRNQADGVIFCAPSFCDPALLDQPMLTSALDDAKVPYTQFKYSENTGQFQVIREQAGTFSDSVKLWGTT